MTMFKLEKGTFGLFPAKYMRGRSTNEQIVFTWLMFHANENGECFPSIDTIHDESMVERHAIVKAIINLENDGLISVIRKRGCSNRYKLLPFLLIHNQCQNNTTCEYPNQCQNNTTTSGDLTLPPVLNHHSNQKKITKTNNQNALMRGGESFYASERGRETGKQRAARKMRELADSAEAEWRASESNSDKGVK